MDRLTLDTNILLDWAWCEGLNNSHRYGDDPGKKLELRNQFQTLIRDRDSGKCELGITTQLYTDFSEKECILPKEINNMIGPYVDLATPSLFSLPTVFPVVFANKNEFDAIFRTVFPLSKPKDSKYIKNQKDAMQLYAHKVAGRDYFLTSDKAILRKVKEIIINFGINVLNLKEYLSRK